MKTQVIHLSQNDDLISVRDKMSWSQAGRILLIWPKRGEMLNHKLELKLLARHAADMGARLALVTEDRLVRFNAHELGIPVFANPRSALGAEWSKFQSQQFQRQDKNQHNKLVDLYKLSHPRTPKWLEHPVMKVFCLMTSLLALLALVILILPGAVITLTPKADSQSIVFNLIIDPSISSINYASGSLPACDQQASVEGQDEADATGSVGIPDQYATGELRFTNYSEHTITIPPGTAVSTGGIEPIRFLTTSKENITIEPGKAAVIPARAVQPGSSGNLEADELVVIEGMLEPDLWVTNPEATAGGTEALVASPTTEDVSRLHQRLVSKLMQKAQVELQSALPDGDILITPTITNVEILSETVFPSVGEPANKLELSLKIKVQTQAVSRQTLSMLVNPLMDAHTPTGYSPQADSLDFTELRHPTLGNDGKVYWTIRASRKLSAMITTQQVPEMVRGNTISQSMVRLSSSLPLEEQASIKLIPSWWPRMPFLTMRIAVLQKGVQ